MNMPEHFDRRGVVWGGIVSGIVAALIGALLLVGSYSSAMKTSTIDSFLAFWFALFSILAMVGGIVFLVFAALALALALDPDGEL